MLTQTLTDARAWEAGTLDQPARWYLPLSERCLAALDEALAQLARHPRPIADVRAEGALAACAGELRPALEALEKGRGFVVIELPPERFAKEQWPTVYWLVGQLLARPIEQNVQGTILYDVRDTGQDVRYGARFSVTNTESTFHTDNAFCEEATDYVGLLCIQPARTGGLSQVVSAHAVHNRLLREQPELLKTLYQTFHVDRRSGVRPGEGPTVRVPVMQWDGQGLFMRYLRYWIEAGHEKVGEPLTPAQTQAFDALDKVLADPSLRAEFALKPGDMFFTNNRWILHNRTGFEDYAEPERKRHLVRLWLRRG